jgi:NAD(P)-dependent dehydrogenase (short-subunit alcohol dehydrogenase family)
MDKIAIITGADSGMGRETALALANKNYIVIMASMNITNAHIVCDEIKLMSGNKNVAVYKIDLSSIASIKQFVQTFLHDFRFVNILINNAGITTLKHEITEDGFEKTMAVNTIGPYILTRLLLPHFPAGGDNRIINLSSSYYKFGKFSIKKINKYHYTKAYAVSKYAQLLVALELADNLKEKGITINAVHPGIVRTGIMLTNVRWRDFIINILLAPFYISPEKGAQTCVYLASSDEVKHETGNYYSNFKRIIIPKKYNNKELRIKLIQYFESIFSDFTKK